MKSKEERNGVKYQLRRLQKLSAKERSEAAASLASKPAKSSEFVLMLMANDPSPGVRCEVMTALAKLSEPGARVVARALLTDKSSNVRLIAAEVLLSLADESDRFRLRLALEDTDWRVRSSAAMGLERLPGHKTLEALKRCLISESHPAVRRDIALALARLGKQLIVPELLRAHEVEKDPIARIGLLWGLYECGVRDKLHEVLELVDHTDPIVRSNAINVIDVSHLARQDHILVGHTLDRHLLREGNSGITHDTLAVLKRLHAHPGKGKRTVQKLPKP